MFHNCRRGSIQCSRKRVQQPKNVESHVFGFWKNVERVERPLYQFGMSEQLRKGTSAHLDYSASGACDAQLHKAKWCEESMVTKRSSFFVYNMTWWVVLSVEGRRFIALFKQNWINWSTTMLMLMFCYVSQGNVATCARCGRIFNIRLTRNLLRKVAVRFY